MSESASESWYLDPVVADQKAAVNRALVGRWADASRDGTVLKTDLFEEANGTDHILDALTAYGARVVGMDWASSTVARARQRFPDAGIDMTVTDLCAMNFQSGTFDLIVSTSTLDHFNTRWEFLQALKEMHRVLSPGGRMVLVIDNPLNPGYWPLRLLCGRAASFRLGYTMTQSGFRGELEDLGLRTVGVGYAIHNPRMVSTILFLFLRRLLGNRAEPAIRGCVKLFEFVGKLPIKPLTACFSVVCVDKPDVSETG